MPLITKLFPKLERAQQADDGTGNVTLKHQREVEEQYDDEYSDFGDGEDDEVDMDGNSILHRPRPKKLVPDLPAKSQLRASHIIEDLTFQLDSREQAALDGLQKQNVEDPHEHYLSSEEEASESADDGYDESIIELDSDRPSSSRASSRHGHEVVARVVSFMFVGKPTIVDITLQKPKNLLLQQRFSSRRPSHPKLTPSVSMSSLRHAASRSSSLGAPTNTLTVNVPKNKSVISVLASKANFLSYDPFPEAQETSVPSPSADSASDAGSQTSMKDSWKLNRRFSLSSKHRKQSSSNLARLNTGAMSAIALPVQSNVTATPVPSSPVSIKVKRSSTGADSEIVRYEDIMRSAIRAPPPPSPASAKSPRMAKFTRKRMLKA